jgi:hypothetical protein
VADYQVYIIDGNGRVRLSETFEARGDDEAIIRLQGLDGGGDTLELWQGGRLLRRLPADV